MEATILENVLLTHSEDSVTTQNFVQNFMVHVVPNGHLQGILQTFGQKGIVRTQPF